MAVQRQRLPKGVVSRWEMNSHTTRYRLANGWFIDRCRYDTVPWRYVIYFPGGDPSGGAARVGGANKLADAIAEAFRLKPEGG